MMREIGYWLDMAGPYVFAILLPLLLVLSSIITVVLYCTDPVGDTFVYWGIATILLLWSNALFLPAFFE